MAQVLTRGNVGKDVWCRVCCTRHVSGPRCPGDLTATGPERPGWRVEVDTANGAETWGVMVAPTRGGWRARVVTYPNIIWAVPGVGSMKFHGESPGAAEQGAIDFVRRHAASRGVAIKQHTPAAVDNPDVEPEPGSPRERKPAPPLRRLRSVPLRFGIRRVHYVAETDNVSEAGLFIRTDQPLPRGTRLDVELESGEGTLCLRGTVCWTRDVGQPGRPPGMGVRLEDPPEEYLRFTRESVPAG